jgi:hypothetical protein
MSSYGEKRHWPYAVAAVALITIFLSAQQQSRLKATPPEKFFSPATNKGKDVEAEIAAGYWTCARNVIQFKYHYGSMLPLEPPSDFALPSGGPAGITIAAQKRARLRYWENLRQVWLLPDSWDTSYTLDFSWVRSGIDRLKTGRLPRLRELD